MEFFKKHLKLIVLWTSITATAQLVPALISNEWSSWQFYLYGSLITGIFIAVFVSIIHYHKLKKMKVDIKDLSREDLLTTQSAVINTSYSREEIIKKTEKFFRKKSTQVSENMIEIRTSSWYGWNKTMVELLPSENLSLQLKITSKPFLPTTIFDFSENLKIVKNLKNELMN